ncbi:DENN domain-containing protein 3-like [Stylophora pistillata]|uniref:DENN domain-containing protein 3-like n=1 Tax=Stylophora pistillata TaxID=50429 RepID=UPI000C03C632|nr:DENN domain-containing protein 3-like [Stylophora pistillata]
MDLHYPFLYFSLDDIHLLMSCILTQQRIVFLSSSYSLLTPVIESLFTFIQPFLWSWTYVPILPSALLDLVEAPGAFIMGCHREHKSKIERVVKEMDEFSTFVIADIDEGSVKSPPRIQRLPTYAAELYKFRMKNAVIHFDSLLLQRQTFYSLQEWKESRDQFVRNFQQLVLASNLEMMLRMFSDIKNYIVQQEDLFFDMDTYIESKPLDNQGFFREVCKSHGFSMFLYDLIHNPEKTDYFTLMAQKTRVVPKVGPLRKRSSSALSAVPVIPDQCFVNALLPVGFSVPTGRFYEDYLKSLNTKITDPTNMSSSLLASHLYLRGMLRIARRENTKAVDDFFGVSSRSAQLFPSSTVKEIICKLSDSEVAELKTRHFWRKAELLRIDAKEKWNYIRERKEVVTSAIPSTPLALEEFVKHASMLQIANSQDAGRRLFQALTNDSTSTVVDPETFATFYYAFTEASIKAKSLSLRNIVLERNEYVLKVSKHIKTNKGMGWLVLTVDRLLFLPDGTQNCTSVLCNDEIMNVEPHSESRLSRYGYSDTAIRITSTARDSVSFIAHVKEEKDFWRSCLLEMKAAYMISDIYKDKEIVKQAAQNVIMADSLSQSNYSDQVAMQVLYYSTQSHHKSKLTRPTEKTLFMRVNPSPQDIEKTTVEALLYVPGSKERERKIWCAMPSNCNIQFDPHVCC